MSGRRLGSLISLILAAGILSSFVQAVSCVPVKYPLKETYTETVLVTENRTESYEETVPVVTTVSGEEVIAPYIIWSNPSLTFKGNESVWYYGYRLPGIGAHVTEKIRISLLKQDYYEYAVISVFDMSPGGQVLRPPSISPSDPLQPPSVEWQWLNKVDDTTGLSDWLNLANIKFNFARFLGGQSDLWLNRAVAYSIEFDMRGAREIAVVIAAPTTSQNARFTASLLWTDNTTENVTRTVLRQVPYRVERKAEKQRTVYETRQAPFWETLPGALK